MPNAKQLPPLHVLRAELEYEPEAGLLRWRHCSWKSVQWNGKFAGKVTGQTPQVSGRLVVNLGRRLCLAHRLAWKLYYGAEPPEHIDHIDGVPTNNRISNLRAATRHENLRNSRRHKGKTLPKGVSRCRNAGRLRASIYINGQQKHLGSFDSADAAHAAYCEAAKAAFGAFARFA